MFNEYIIQFELLEWFKTVFDQFFIVLDFVNDFVRTIQSVLDYIFERLPYNALNRMIIYMIMIFFVSLIVLLPTILISKLYLSYKKTKYNQLHIKYSQLVIGFLIGSKEKDEVADIDKLNTSRFHRNVMIDVLVDIDKAENKEVSDKIRNLYIDLELNKESIRKLNMLSWNKKIFGIRELSHMRVKSENQKIISYQQKSNDILRIEAQMGLIKLLPFVPFAFLDSQEKVFTVWEQINVFDLIRKNRIEIPEFHLWLNHWNDSVVMFSLDMIRILKQKEAVSKVLELINHDNDFVKGKVIKTLVDLESYEAIAKLKEVYHLEELPNQLNILRSIGQLRMETELNFLEDKLKSDEFKIRMESCKSILKLGETGQNRLNALTIDADEQLKGIINHVLDPRI
ncbi:HEAT repeat domain-containing protein [Marinifilum sp.]|uniref:HEAT repeat domain-containing protein n=1 Tax=Marinifilum sp. TaxID=2033137 RepID=UPI003BA85FA1